MKFDYRPEFDYTKNMFKYFQAIDELPKEIKGPILKVLELFREEIAETVKKSDFEELKSIVSRVAKAQEELAEAQRRTEQEVRTLVYGLKTTRKELGGLSNTIGYTLENVAFKALPDLLKKEFSIEVEGRLKREFIAIDGRYIEVNILGKARKDGKELAIIGESKSQLSKRHINQFLKRLKILESTIKEERFLLIVTHMAPPNVVSYAKEKGIKVYFSYEF